MYMWTCIYTSTWICILYICSYTHAYIIRISASQYNTRCLSVVPRATMDNLAELQKNISDNKKEAEANGAQVSQA